MGELSVILALFLTIAIVLYLFSLQPPEMQFTFSCLQYAYRYVAKEFKLDYQRATRSLSNTPKVKTLCLRTLESTKRLVTDFKEDKQNKISFSTDSNSTGSGS